MPSGIALPTSAQTRLLESPPSASISKAESRFAYVSAKISVPPSGVITIPFGDITPSAARCAEPSGSTRMISDVSGVLATPASWK